MPDKSLIDQPSVVLPTPVHPWCTSVLCSPRCTSEHHPKADSARGANPISVPNQMFGGSTRSVERPTFSCHPCDLLVLSRPTVAAVATVPAVPTVPRSGLLRTQSGPSLLGALEMVHNSTINLNRTGHSMGLAYLRTLTPKTTPGLIGSQYGSPMECLGIVIVASEPSTMTGPVLKLWN